MDFSSYFLGFIKNNIKFYLFQNKFTIVYFFIIIIIFNKKTRSWHCDFCGFCVAKWEKHSFIFNRCIGAGNQLLYLCFTFSYTILIAICFLCFFMKKSTYHNHSIWGTLMFFSLLINLWSFFQESLIQCFCVNKKKKLERKKTLSKILGLL